MTGYTHEGVRVGTLDERIAALEAENATLRRERDGHLRDAASHFAKSCELADRALSAAAKLAEAVKALEPFADFARLPGFEKLPPDLPVTQGSRLAARQVTVADFLAARAAARLTNQDDRK